MSNSYIDQLAEELLKIESLPEMKTFLKALFTPEEFQSIPLRLQIVKLLKKGVSQREIVKKLGVGIATVTRGSKEISLNHFKNV